MQVLTEIVCIKFPEIFHTKIGKINYLTIHVFKNNKEFHKCKLFTEFCNTFEVMHTVTERG